MHMIEFVGKGKVKQALGPDIYEFLVYDNKLRVESSAHPTDMITLL